MLSLSDIRQQSLVNREERLEGEKRIKQSLLEGNRDYIKERYPLLLEKLSMAIGRDPCPPNGKWFASVPVHNRAISFSNSEISSIIRECIDTEKDLGVNMKLSINCSFTFLVENHVRIATAVLSLIDY